MLLDDIFSHEEYDESDSFCFIFYSAKMLVDFGPFKAGETVDNLVVNFIDGTMTEDNDEGKIVRQTNFKVVPS